jgi:hypothetical protein
VLSALTRLPDTTADRIAKTGDEPMALCRKNPNSYGLPPEKARESEAGLASLQNKAVLINA